MGSAASLSESSDTFWQKMVQSDANSNISKSSDSMSSASNGFTRVSAPAALSRPRCFLRRTYCINTRAVSKVMHVEHGSSIAIACANDSTQAFRNTVGYLHDLISILRAGALERIPASCTSQTTLLFDHVPVLVIKKGRSRLCGLNVVP